MHKAGLFIVFEGGDGAGKSTQVDLLSTHLRNLQYEVVTTFEPGKTQLGQQIRQLLLHGGQVNPHAEALLYAADRAQHVAEVVRPALERGAVVLQDRYIASSIAYQGVARKLGGQEIKALNAWATQELSPQLTIVLDIDPSLAARRMRARDIKPDRLEKESLAFHARVREEFLAIARANPQNHLLLDAAAPAAEIHEQVVARVTQLLQH